jgi:hypothetical protein
MTVKTESEHIFPLALYEIWGEASAFFCRFLWLHPGLHPPQFVQAVLYLFNREKIV